MQYARSPRRDMLVNAGMVMRFEGKFSNELASLAKW